MWIEPTLTDFPLESLVACSKTDLLEFRLQRLALASALRKEIKDRLEQWAEAEAAALLSDVLLRKRERIAQLSLPFLSAQESPQRANGRKANRKAILRARNLHNVNLKSLQLEGVA